MAHYFDNSQCYETSANLVKRFPETMACWFRTDTDRYGALMMTTADAATNDDLLTMRYDNDQHITVLSRVGGAQVFVDTSNTHTLGTWNHAISTFVTSAERHGWLNNAGMSTNTQGPQVPDLSRQIVIGRHATDYHHGGIAEAGIWDIELDAFARWQLYECRMAPPLVRPDHLVWYRSFLFPDPNSNAGIDLSRCPYAGSWPDLTTLDSPVAVTDHPKHIVYPLSQRTAILSAGVSPPAPGGHAGPLVGGNRLKSKLQGLVA